MVRTGEERRAAARAPGRGHVAYGVLDWQGHGSVWSKEGRSWSGKDTGVLRELIGGCWTCFAKPELCTTRWVKEGAMVQWHDNATAGSGFY